MGPGGDAPRIERGLGRYGDDYHAVLGVPVTADSKRIRRGFLSVVKALHPDRYVGRPRDVELANWLFSKLISPANEVMNKESERVEYELAVQLRVRRLIENPPADLWPDSEWVQKLRRSAQWESDYVAMVDQLAAEQYQSLSNALERVSQISELNLTYLLLKAGAKQATTAQPTPARRVPTTQPTAAVPASLPIKPDTPRPAPSPPEPPTPSAGETRFAQALTMIERGQYKEAIQFLNIALAAEPNQPRYFVHRGIAQQKLGNRGMARIDFQKALRLDPDNEDAKRGLRATEQTGQPVAQPNINAPQPKPPPPNKDNGGFFGLFKRK